MIKQQFDEEKEVEELTKLLEENHSKNQVAIIADLIYKKDSLFPILVYLSLKNQPIIPQRASWVLEEISKNRPKWITPFIEEMTEKLSTLEHNGTQRNVAKILARSPLPIKHLGGLLNTCFNWIQHRETAIAVRIPCMTIVHRISEIEPDIEAEFKELLYSFVETGSAGERSRAKLILNKMEQKYY